MALQSAVLSWPHTVDKVENQLWIKRIQQTVACWHFCEAWPMSLPEIGSIDAFQTTLLQNAQTVAFFWARWSEPCEALSEVIDDVLLLLIRVFTSFGCADLNDMLIAGLSGSLRLRGPSSSGWCHVRYAEPCQSLLDL